MSEKEMAHKNGFQKFMHRPEFATLIIFIAMIVIVAALQLSLIHILPRALPDRDREDLDNNRLRKFPHSFPAGND